MVVFSPRGSRWWWIAAGSATARSANPWSARTGQKHVQNILAKLDRKRAPRSAFVFERQLNANCYRTGGEIGAIVNLRI